MKLIAQKPCSFGGKNFFIGDEIPAELVVAPKAQEKMGVLAVISDEVKPFVGLHEMVTQVVDVKFEIVIHAQEGDLSVHVTNEELSVFTDILQIGTSKADEKQKISEIIQNIESEDILILLDALDGRKYIKDVVLARAKIITGTKEKDTEEEVKDAGDK